jgi:hypothetical protein
VSVIWSAGFSESGGPSFGAFTVSALGDSSLCMGTVVGSVSSLLSALDSFSLVDAGGLDFEVFADARKINTMIRIEVG